MNTPTIMDINIFHIMMDIHILTQMKHRSTDVIIFIIESG